MSDLLGSFKGCNHLAEEIFVEYIDDRELISIKDLYSKIELLIDNKMATKVTGYGSRNASNYITFAEIASYYFIKRDKSFKKFRYRREEIKSRYIDEPVEPEIIKYKKNLLENGDYIVKLDKYSYALLHLDDDKESDYDDFISVTIYFVGDNYNKYKNEFLKFNDEVKSLNKFRRSEMVIYGNEAPKRDRFKSFDQMVFKEKDKIVSYINKWVENIPQYYQYGMTPKLSILLYGKPGTGKSTFYKALAKHLGINVVKQLAPDNFIDTPIGKKGRLRYSDDYDDEAVIAIDDIDCFCKSREDDKDDNNSKVILSKLLSFLDTPPTLYYKSKDDIYYPISVVVATTNYIDRLDPAVIRYGRFDYIIEMQDLDEEESREFCNIYDLTLEDVVDKSEIVEDFTISPAKLQALCFENIDKRLKGRENE